MKGGGGGFPCFSSAFFLLPPTVPRPDSGIKPTEEALWLSVHAAADRYLSRVKVKRLQIRSGFGSLAPLDAGVSPEGAGGGTGDLRFDEATRLNINLFVLILL